MKHKNKEELLCSKCPYKTYADRYLKSHMKVHLEVFVKGDYPRTRASDFKHLSALIHSIVLVNILGLFLIFALSTKKSGFTIVLY